MVMNILTNINNPFSRKKRNSDSEPKGAIYPAGTFWGINFDGEQEPYALNTGIVYDVDYYELAARAYTLVTINEYARTMIVRLAEFVVGTGLRLHPNPSRNLLKRLFNVKLPEDFSKNIQELWSLFEIDKNVSITKDQTIHKMAKTVYYNGLIAGDILVVNRIKDGCLVQQLINGMSVRSSKSISERKNKVVDGVEIDENEKPIGYYVIDKDGKEQYIKARDSKDRLIAWLVPCGIKKLNSPRSYSIIGATMQKLNKIGQYSNSEVMAAETNAKFAAWIEQDKESSGVNPMKNIPGIDRILKNQGVDVAETTSQEEGVTQKRFRDSLKRIASGLFIHMPKGQKLNSFDTKRPNVNHTSFVDGSMKYITASGGIPFEVYLMQFSNNFSASRAALKMFEVILQNNRQFSIIDYYYQPTYERFFELECLKGNIFAPRYLELKNDDGYLDNAYTRAKWVGVKIPHIDEVKEVNAVLSKLKGGLTTFEQSLEDLGITQDFDSIIERRKIEEEKIRNAGLNFETLFAPDGGASNDDDTEADSNGKK